MKKTIFFIFAFCFLVMTFNVQALSISPGELEFDMEVGTEICKSLTIGSSEGYEDLLGKVNWLEDFNKLGVLSEYQLETSGLPLDVSFVDTVTQLEEEIELNICITAEEAGRYEGVIVYSSPPESGKSIAVATWLRVMVTETTEQENNIENDNSINTGSGGSRKSGTVGLTVQTNNSTGQENAEGDYELLAADAEAVTEQAENIDEKEKNTFERLDLLSPLRLIPILVIIGLIVGSVLVKKKRQKMRQMGMI